MALASGVAGEDGASVLKRLRAEPRNSSCADCTTTYPAYVVIEFGTWVCPGCAAAHEELGHTSRSAAKPAAFSRTELRWLEAAGGNGAAALVYLARMGRQPAPSQTDAAFVAQVYRDYAFAESAEAAAAHSFAAFKEGRFDAKTGGAAAGGGGARSGELDAAAFAALADRATSPQPGTGLRDLLGDADAPENATVAASSAETQPQTQPPPAAAPVAAARRALVRKDSDFNPFGDFVGADGSAVPLHEVAAPPVVSAGEFDPFADDDPPVAAAAAAAAPGEPELFPAPVVREPSPGLVEEPKVVDASKESVDTTFVMFDNTPHDSHGSIPGGAAASFTAAGAAAGGEEAGEGGASAGAERPPLQRQRSVLACPTCGKKLGGLEWASAEVQDHVRSCREQSGKRTNPNHDVMPVIAQTQRDSKDDGDGWSEWFDLSKEPWYFGAIDRREAERLLKACSADAFLLRTSSQEDSYALSIYRKRRNRITHTLVQRSPGGWRLQDTTRTYATLLDVVKLSKECRNLIHPPRGQEGLE